MEVSSYKVKFMTILQAPKREVCFVKQYLEKEAEQGKGKHGFGKTVSCRPLTEGRQKHGSALLWSAFFHHGETFSKQKGQDKLKQLDTRLQFQNKIKTMCSSSFSHTIK